VRVAEPSGLEPGFDVIERSVPYEAWVVRPLPNAVVQLDDFNVTDLEFHDLAARGLREGRPGKLDRPVETEGGAGRCRRYDKSST
jgi:hypothetical protein